MATKRKTEEPTSPAAGALPEKRQRTESALSAAATADWVVAKDEDKSPHSVGVRVWEDKVPGHLRWEDSDEKYEDEGDEELGIGPAPTPVPAAPAAALNNDAVAPPQLPGRIGIGKCCAFLLATGRGSYRALSRNPGIVCCTDPVAYATDLSLRFVRAASALQLRNARVAPLPQIPIVVSGFASDDAAEAFGTTWKGVRRDLRGQHLSRTIRALIDTLRGIQKHWGTRAKRVDPSKSPPLGITVITDSRGAPLDPGLWVGAANLRDLCTQLKTLIEQNTTIPAKCVYREITMDKIFQPF
jgi:hypothetical protein